MKGDKGQDRETGKMNFKVFLTWSYRARNRKE
jgi:hypothetical protein